MSKRQQVWRTLSKSTNNGFFVWDIMEVIGEANDSYIPMYHSTLDSGYIFIQCYHFWTEESANNFLNDNLVDDYQIVEIIN